MTINTKPSLLSRAFHTAASQFLVNLAGDRTPLPRERVGPSPQAQFRTRSTHRPGDTVVFTISGPPGYNAALAFSFSNLGAGPLNGQPLLLGPDLSVLTGGSIGPGGSFTSSAAIPTGLQGEVFLQGAVWPPGTDPGTSATLTNRVALLIPPQDAENGILIGDLALKKNYPCGSTRPIGIQLEALILGTKPICEVSMQAPTGTVFRLLPLVEEPDLWMTRAGYDYAFGFEYEDNAGETNLGLFPIGTYTFTVTFPDGRTAWTRAMERSGSWGNMSWPPPCGGRGSGT